MTFLKISFVTLNMVWTALRRPGRLSNKNRLSLTYKGNSKPSKAVVTGLKEEKVVKPGENLCPLWSPETGYDY